MDVLKRIGKRAPSSEKFAQSLALASLAEALERRNEEALEEALGKISGSADKQSQQFLLQELRSSNWPHGFDRVSEHFKLGEGEHNVLSAHCEQSLLMWFIEGHAFELVAHLWKKWPKEERESYIWLGLGLGLAQAIASVGEEKSLSALAERSEKEIEVKKVIVDAVDFLDRVQRTGHGEKFGRATSPQRVKATHEVLRALLAGRRPPLIKCFWESVCRTDNVEVLKDLVENEVIAQGHTHLYRSPKEFFSQFKGSSMRKAPFWWLKNYNVKESQWHYEASVARKFTFAELLCVLGEKSVKVLGHCLMDDEFRRDVVSSPLALHALVVGTYQRGAWGVNLFAELKARGVDLTTVVGDAGQNPLHEAVRAYQRTGQDKELLRALVMVYPPWATAKNVQGKVPTEESVSGPSEEKSASLSEAQCLIEEALLQSVVARNETNSGKEELASGKRYRV